MANIFSRFCVYLKCTFRDNNFLSEPVPRMYDIGKGSQILDSVTRCEFDMNQDKRMFILLMKTRIRI